MHALILWIPSQLMIFGNGINEKMLNNKRYPNQVEITSESC